MRELAIRLMKRAVGLLDRNGDSKVQLSEAIDVARDLGELMGLFHANLPDDQKTNASTAMNVAFETAYQRVKAEAAGLIGDAKASKDKRHGTGS